MKRWALLVLLLAACDGGAAAVEPDPEPTRAKPGPDPSTPVGVYQLVTVNGAAPPVLLRVLNGTQIFVVSGSVTLEEDGTARDRHRTRYYVPQPGAVPTEREDERRGTYRRDGDSIRVTWAADTLHHALRWAGLDLTRAEGGTVNVYRK